VRKELLMKIRRRAQYDAERHENYAKQARKAGQVAQRLIEVLPDSVLSTLESIDIEVIGEKIIFYSQSNKIAHALTKLLRIHFQKTFDEHFGEFAYQTKFGSTTIIIRNVKFFGTCKLVLREEVVKVKRYELKCRRVS